MHFYFHRLNFENTIMQQLSSSVCVLIIILYAKCRGSQQTDAPQSSWMMVADGVSRAKSHKNIIVHRFI